MNKNFVIEYFDVVLFHETKAKKKEKGKKRQKQETKRKQKRKTRRKEERKKKRETEKEKVKKGEAKKGQGERKGNTEKNKKCPFQGENRVFY